MRVVTPLLSVLALACLARAADEKPEAPGGGAFVRCVKVLKYGDVNEFFEPAKGDAVAALGLLGDERAVPVLVEHLENEKDANLRLRIVKALGWLKSPRAVPALEKALKDPDEYVRTGAAMALKGITGKDYKVEQGPAEAVPGLDELAKELARLQGPGQQSIPGKPFLEAGKRYCFAFGGAQGRDVIGKVVEAPVGNWVKVQVGKGERPVTSWVNLTAVATVTLESDGK
jgi:hypothetical protein